MTTYNGEKYIVEQLDSIRNQTRVPDEVIIYDDCSSDLTTTLIKKYINDNDLTNWILHCNEHNLGWRKNFIEAMQAAKGDLIFLSDQDDIWNCDKIEDMASAIDNNRDILLLASNCEIFYTSNDKRTKYPPFYSFKKKAFYLDKIWANKGLISVFNRLLKGKKGNSGKLTKVSFDSGLFSGQRQGCVMAFKRRILEDAVKYWNEECPHDTLLWLYAAVHEGLYLLEKKTIKYRHHSSNTGFTDTLGSGLTAENERKKIKSQIDQIESLTSMLNNSESELEKKAVLSNITAYLKLRDGFLKDKKIKDGIEVIKKKGNVGNRQVLFDWLLTYFT